MPRSTIECCSIPKWGESIAKSEHLQKTQSPTQGSVIRVFEAAGNIGVLGRSQAIRPSEAPLSGQKR